MRDNCRLSVEKENNLKKDIISILDLSIDEIDKIINVANLRDELFVKYKASMQSKIAGTLFFQPSSRTKLSFQSAFIRLGGQYIGFSDIEESRCGRSYNEKLCDLGRIIDAYCDLIILRHFDNSAAFELAENTKIPLISAGNGTDEHPTQGLTDLYTIHKEFGTFDGLQIMIIGTFPSRSMNSLIIGLSRYNDVHFHIIGNNSGIPTRFAHYNITLYSSFNDFDSKREHSLEINVIYVTEIKPNTAKSEKYVLHSDVLSTFPNAIIMCPLPRTSELPFSIDRHDSVRYFYQAKNGLYVRAAIYLHIFQII